MAASDTTPVPAYVSFLTFTRFIDSLGGQPIPTKVERAQLPKMSGTAQAQLLAALRYLGLIREGGTPEDDLTALKDARGTDAWAGALRAVLERAYAAILANVNIKRGTTSELRDAFKTHGGMREGQAMTKAMRFFLKAMNDAGEDVSPHFKLKTPQPGKTRTRKQKSSRPENDSGGGNGSNEEGVRAPAPQGHVDHEFRLPGREHPGRIVVPRDMADDDWKFFDMAVTYLKAYLAALPPAQGPKDEEDDQ